MTISLLKVVGMLLVFGFLWWAAHKLLSDYPLLVAQIVIGLLALLWLLGLMGVGPGLVFI